MKTLFVGGIKSGKSALAEKYILKHTNTPIYLATTEILDDEMRIRVDAHIKQRADKFETIEEAIVGQATLLYPIYCPLSH